MALLEAQLDAGAIGIGMLLGYAPATGADELAAVARLAARRGVALFVHVRFGSGANGADPAASVREVVDLSRATGARVHLCHFSSSNARGVREGAEVIGRARPRDCR